MAAHKSYLSRQSHRFLTSSSNPSGDSIIFEFDESEVWNDFIAVRPPSLDFLDVKTRKSPPIVATAASLPVSVPDWSKILKEEYIEKRNYDDDGDLDDDGSRDMERVPPHEFLARARNASSVHQGIGRTLKGRDLSRVRNAVWRKTGFLG